MQNKAETSSRLSDSTSRFGRVSIALHWLTACLIFSMIALGLAASYWPFDTAETLATKARLFSFHKTLGVLTFFVAALRILWRLTQSRPAALAQGGRLQHFAAETVHWSLYVALVAVPLTGWVHHAASIGFAPILWPLGQGLPFVPKSLEWAAVFGKLHYVFNIVLASSIALHVVGALRHHVIDKDETLRRMLSSRVEILSGLRAAASHRASVFAAAVVWCGATGLAVSLAMAGKDQATSASAAPALAAVPSDWVVQDGQLGITISQFGQALQGHFADWTAAISYSDTPQDGVYGEVSVTISIPSLTLGSATQDALSPDFLDVANHQTAQFSGPIVAAEDGFRVAGTLQLREISAPVDVLFDLAIEDGVATASGTAVLDRRDYNMGAAYDDEASVGFGVDITFDLVATQ